MANVQIDRELFDNILDYFLDEESNHAKWLEDEIIRKLMAKLDKLLARELFTKYKRSLTGEEREQARREYLNHVGMLPAFRTDEEWHDEVPPD